MPDLSIHTTHAMLFRASPLLPPLVIEVLDRDATRLGRFMVENPDNGPYLAFQFFEMVSTPEINVGEDNKMVFRGCPINYSPLCFCSGELFSVEHVLKEQDLTDGQIRNMLAEAAKRRCSQVVRLGPGRYVPFSPEDMFLKLV